MQAPRDDAGEEDSLLVGVINKLFFVLTLIPLRFGWMAKLAKRRKSTTCPNCGLPLMVKLASDAGWLAKRKADLKAGSVVIIDGVAYPADSPEVRAFRAQQPVETPIPKPDKLPGLDAMLAPAHQLPVEPAEKDSVTPPDTAEKPPENVTKKPRVDPDAW